MIDYAQTAETLHAMIGDVDELYHHAVAPRNKQALTAAAALCEAHAAPVDEVKERAEFEKWLDVYDYHMKQYKRNGVLKSGTTRWCYTYADTATLFSAWCAARARSDARAKVAEAWQPIESAPKDRKARLVYVPDNKCIYEVYWDEVRLMWITFGGGCVLPYEPTHWQPLPPPPTVEGERG